MLPIILIVALLIFTYLWYVAIIKRRNTAQESLSGIDVQLQKRGELIPNILAIAKKFLDHEKSLFSEITALREKVSTDYDKGDESAVKEHLAAAESLQGKMGQLFVQVEDYPELKSNETMVTAMQSYNEVEAQIAAARRFYNSSVTSLNNAVQIFPGNVIGGLAGVKALPFYEAPEATLAPVSAAAHLG